MDAPDNAPVFSVASLWEIAIKSGPGRDDFRADARVLRRGLLDNGYAELPVAGDHAVAIDGLPPIHEDPFDRILVAQATVEGITLLTADRRWRGTPARSGASEGDRRPPPRSIGSRRGGRTSPTAFGKPLRPRALCVYERVSIDA